MRQLGVLQVVELLSKLGEVLGREQGRLEEIIERVHAAEHRAWLLGLKVDRRAQGGHAGAEVAARSNEETSAATNPRRLASTAGAVDVAAMRSVAMTRTSSFASGTSNDSSTSTSRARLPHAPPELVVTPQRAAQLVREQAELDDVLQNTIHSARQRVLLRALQPKVRPLKVRVRC